MTVLYRDASIVNFLARFRCAWAIKQAQEVLVAGVDMGWLQEPHSALSTLSIERLVNY